MGQMAAKDCECATGDQMLPTEQRAETRNFD